MLFRSGMFVFSSSAEMREQTVPRSPLADFENQVMGLKDRKVSGPAMSTETEPGVQKRKRGRPRKS